MIFPEAKYIANAFHLHCEFVEGQKRLLALIDAASSGDGAWPSDDQYGCTLALARATSLELKLHLEHCRASRNKSRVERIQRASLRERGWQPSPELWLMQQDAAPASDPTGGTQTDGS